jgi:hypothetical protein
MRCHIPGLHQDCLINQNEEALQGMFLVRVDQVSYRYHSQKPFLILSFGILEPKELAGQTFSGRLSCTQRALWKLRWFLRDFGYDPELLSGDVIEEKLLRGLRGVVKLSQATVRGRTFLNLDGFAPVEKWGEVQAELPDHESREPIHDI